MKITDKIIFIPPYISTSWDKVASLHMKDQQLIVTLKDGTTVFLPNLSAEVVEQIFSAHIIFLEREQQTKSSQIKESSHAPSPSHVVSQNMDQLIGGPFRMAFGSIEAIGQALQHNPAYSDLPPIPPEMVNKISLLAKSIPTDDIRALPSPEEGCNCIYCQMSRILKQTVAMPADASDHPLIDDAEEEVSDEDLRFEQWEIRSTGEKMYLVTNKLDPNEQYSVYLGDPIGCTCGKSNCEHIVAVLRH